MRKYLTEFIGTFFLVFTVTTAVLGHASLAPLGIGAVLMVMVFAGGHISGAHYNPAVTLAVFIRGRVEAMDAIVYVGVQAVAGLLAALIGKWAVGGKASIAVHYSGRHLFAAFVVELLFTFALAYVVLSTATSKDHPNNSFYGLAIGFTVLAGAVAVGPLSGAVFNPAVLLGVNVSGLLAWSMLPLYLLAMVLGGALAGLAFRYLNPDDLDSAAGASEAAPDNRLRQRRR